MASIPFPTRRTQAHAVAHRGGEYGSFPGQESVRELFRRWPDVPSRELERIRRALLRCQHLKHPGNTHQMSGPALALLEMVTAELIRRHEAQTQGLPRPKNQPPAVKPQPDPGGRKGAA